MVKKPKRTPQLPTQQLLVLAICRFAEPVALTSVNPYLVGLKESIGVQNIFLRKGFLLTETARDDTIFQRPY